MSILGVVLRVLPEQLSAVTDTLSPTPGLDIALNPGDGRLVLILEDTAERAAAQTFATIALLPGVLFLYAVPPEFLRNVVPDYPALDQRLKSPIPLSDRSPQAPVIDLEHLDLDQTHLLVRMGERMLEVFEVAEGWKSDRAMQASNLKNLAQTCTDFAFEIGHRRLFVKTWIDLLFRQRRGGERQLLLEEVERLLQDGALALDGSNDAFVDA